MTSKERAYLTGLANSIPALYQIGKDGIGENTIKLISDALEARELIKVHVLENALTDVRAAAEELAEKTGACVVRTIGSKFILYRRSKKNICEM